MNGIIIIDKPQGITSFGVTAKMRKILNMKKIGHSGTLDPMATGVLTVLFGNCTRFLEVLPSTDKEYTATLKLGLLTDTLDITGTVLEKRAVNVSNEQFAEACESFKGKIIQKVPMYSAVSVDGKRLYELARQGKTIETPSREITVYSLDILQNDGDEYVIKVRCSSGTYIRQLIADIGEKLGTVATMTALRRTEANGFSVDKAYTLEKLNELKENGELEKAVIPIDEALGCYPKVTVSAPQSIRFHNGGELSLERLRTKIKKGLYRVYSPDNEFLGLGEADEENLNVKRVYVGD